MCSVGGGRDGSAAALGYALSRAEVLTHVVNA